MATNLIDRTPIPGSFGVPVGINVDLHLQTTGTIASNTVSVRINTVYAIQNGAFQPNFAGTLVSDGSGGWTISINPTTNLAYNTTISVRVEATEQPGSVVFDQTYTFQTIRNIQAAGAVRYYEEGDIVEADLYVHEGEDLVPDILDTCTFTLLRQGTTVQTFKFDNVTRMADQDGYFAVRLLHPPAINQECTWEFSASVDGYAAPGVGTINIADDLVWVTKDQQVVPDLFGATQPPLRAAEVLPRHTPSEYNDKAVITEATAQYEVVDISKSGHADEQPSVLVDLDFLDADQYVQTLTGDLTYTGGGNRILGGITSADTWFLQDADEIPPTFGARTLIEPAVENLHPNSNMLTNPFTVTLPDPTVRADEELIDLTSDASVKQVHYLIEGSILFDGSPRNLRVAGPMVPVTPGQNVYAGVYARNKLRDSSVTLDTFALRVRFFNNTDTEVYSIDFNYDVFDFETPGLNLMSGMVPSGSIPGTTAKASIELITGSWEGCDLMELWLAAPFIEYASYATSPVVGTAAATRALDSFRFQGAGNLNCRFGSIEMEYFSQFDGFPPVHTTLWDTRAGGLNGYTLRCRSDGRYELTAYDAAGLTATALSAPVSLVAGETQTVRASWTPTSIQITRNQLVLATTSGAFSQPTAPQAYVWVGTRYDQTEPMLAELHSMRVLGG